jgi:hypothetical protein
MLTTQFTIKKTVPEAWDGFYHFIILKNNDNLNLMEKCKLSLSVSEVFKEPRPTSAISPFSAAF